MKSPFSYKDQFSISFIFYLERCIEVEKIQYKKDKLEIKLRLYYDKEQFIKNCDYDIKNEKIIII